MQIKHWVLIAGLVAGASMLAACGQEKKADEAAPAAPAASGEAAPAAAGEAPAEEKKAE